MPLVRFVDDLAEIATKGLLTLFASRHLHGLLLQLVKALELHPLPVHPKNLQHLSRDACLFDALRPQAPLVDIPPSDGLQLHCGRLLLLQAPLMLNHPVGRLDLLDRQ